MVGVTPGAFFVIFLVALDINVATATATGLFLVMMTAASATINSIVFQLVDLQYLLLIGTITVGSTLPGVYGQALIVRLAGGRF